MSLLSKGSFPLFEEYVRTYYGINLDGKESLMQARLGVLCQSKGFDSLHDYFSFALASPESGETERIIDRLTTNHTYFMRESEHFRFFMDTALPWMTNEAGRRRDLRIWCAGCSSGEEAYTLAICSMEFLKAEGLSDWNSVVLATDLSRKALLAAARGVYPGDEMAELPHPWISNYFRQHGDSEYQVTGALRKNVAFKRMNLIDPFDFKTPFHSVFCRNVMIYFDNNTKMDVLEKLYSALKPGGYLFIGHSESLAQLNNDFIYIQPSVYRKPFK
ncbi:MAG: protein-glutamate O-methyltransferase CheR [Clostridiales Family XIII bacterium]|jgi:chemotaxis protein methyltransferase CheR|nr:protein-glutamate O-methyltransferase CheR [Clostridiales Family XIII bacterium]